MSESSDAVNRTLTQLYAAVGEGLSPASWELRGQFSRDVATRQICKSSLISLAFACGNGP
jgi:hypothetical protein